MPTTLSNESLLIAVEHLHLNFVLRVKKIHLASKLKMNRMLTDRCISKLQAVYVRILVGISAQLCKTQNGLTYLSSFEALCFDFSAYYNFSHFVVFLSKYFYKATPGAEQTTRDVC